jgi:hypothetical protein
LDALLNFLETKVIAHLLKGREGRCVGEDGAKMLVLFVEAVEYVKDEHTIRDVGAKIVEGVGEALYFLGVVIHVEVALNEVTKDGIDVEDTGLTVADELVLQGQPGVVSRVTVLTSHVLQLRRDGVVEPRPDDGVHPVLGRNVGESGVR